MSLAAAAAELPIVSIPQNSSDSLSYPAVGFSDWEPELALTDSTELTVEAVLPDIAAETFADRANPPSLDRQAKTQTAELAKPSRLGTMLVHLNVEGDQAEAHAAENGFIREAFEQVELPPDDVGVSEVGEPILVKGAEDGYQAQSLQNWLIPFDDVVKALGFTATLQVDGRLELRSPTVVTQVRLDELTVDPDLGPVWSVAEIEDHLGTSVEFDRSQYVIRFNQSAVNQSALAQPNSAQYSLTDSGIAFAQSYSAEVAATAELIAAAVPGSSEPRIASDSFPPNDSELSSIEASSPSIDSSVDSSELGVMLVGLAVDSITTVEATLVRGKEDGVSAISFDQWRIPFDDAMTALGGDVTPQPDGTLAIRIPGVATSVDPAVLLVDPDLGMTLSIAEIEETFGIPAEFNFSQYAIKFLPPLLSNPQNIDLGGFGLENTGAVVTAGLPLVEPSSFSFSGIRQSTRIDSSNDRLVGSTRGQLAAMGSAFGGSWYSRIEQPSLNDYSTWQIEELQYLNQADARDFIVGSQSTFWRAENGQDYWGATALQRWGFTPPTVDSQGGFSPSQRQQSNQIGRTVSGAANPGTLVRLTKGLNGRVVSETIVDSSGVYRFDNVPATGQLSNQFYSGGYQVQLFENGQLTNQPEIRSATFTTLPGQLPRGASALVASIGMGHQIKTDRLLGSFNPFRGGLAYRRGMSESLTVGAGFVQDGTPQGLAEFFYLPDGIPFQAAVSAMVDLQDGETRVNADMRYQPAKNLKFAFNSDRFSQRFSADWNVTPAVALIATGNTRESSLSAGIKANYRTNRWVGNAFATFDTRQNLRWNLRATSDTFDLSNYGNEISNYSNLSYYLSKRSNLVGAARLGHEIALTHESHRSQSDGSLQGGQLTTALWRYQSSQSVSDGQSRWRYALGYGISSKGSGPVASISTALWPGLDLQMRYRSVSAFSDSPDFQLSLVSRLDTQNGLSWGRRRQDRLRTQGGLMVQPFLDDNGNGVRDPEEDLYLESPELLFQVNHRVMSRYRAEVQSDGILLVLPPDTYRLDIDPAGLPIDRMTAGTAYAVEVSAGQYTQIALPLSVSHTVSGVVVDENGLAVPGARVEAVSVSGHRRMSITNGAGVYYLERLVPDAYDLVVDGVTLEGEPLLLENQDEAFHQREIQLLRNI